MQKAFEKTKSVEMNRLNHDKLSAANMLNQSEDDMKDVYFVSSQLSNLSENENVRRHEELVNHLLAAGVPFQEVLGCYTGSLESSVLLPSKTIQAPNGVTLEQVMEIADYYNQESILQVVQEVREKLGDLGETSLVYSTGEIEKLGQLVRVSSIRGLDSWSMFGGRIYAVRKIG